MVEEKEEVGEKKKEEKMEKGVLGKIDENGKLDTADA